MPSITWAPARSGCAATTFLKWRFSVLPLLLRHISLGQLIIGRRNVWIQLQTLIKGRHSPWIVLQLVQRGSKLDVGASGLGVELDGLLEGCLGFLVLLLLDVGSSERGVRLGKIRIEIDRLLEMRDPGIVVLGVQRFLPRVKFLSSIIRNGEIGGGHRRAGGVLGNFRWGRPRDRLQFQVDVSLRSRNQVDAGDILFVSRLRNFNDIGTRRGRNEVAPSIGLGLAVIDCAAFCKFEDNVNARRRGLAVGRPNLNLYFEPHLLHRFSRPLGQSNTGN